MRAERRRPRDAIRQANRDRRVTVRLDAWPAATTPATSSGRAARSSPGTPPPRVASCRSTTTCSRFSRRYPVTAALGMFYWEPEWIPGVGWEPGAGTPNDNLTLFSFSGQALPAVGLFQSPLAVCAQLRPEGTAVRGPGRRHDRPGRRHQRITTLDHGGSFDTPSNPLLEPLAREPRRGKVGEMRRCLCALVALVVCVTIGEATAQAAGTAPEAPGVQSYFDLARKDCVGTARNDTSKVWFTVAGGVLSDAYWPNVDATNVHSLQYVVTDGTSFTDLQTRDMTYTSAASPSGMACTVTARSKTHGYRITTTYIADPSRDAVVMKVRFDGPAQRPRVPPPRSPCRWHGRRRFAELGRKYGAARRRPRRQHPCRLEHEHHDPGFQPRLRRRDLRGAPVLVRLHVGERRLRRHRSDGQSMLDSDHALSTSYTDAPNGHVALTAGLGLPRHGRRHPRARLRDDADDGDPHGESGCERTLQPGAEHVRAAVAPLRREPATGRAAS